MKLSNLNVATRLAIGFAIIVFGALVLAASGWYGIRREGAMANVMVDRDVEFLRSVASIRARVLMLRRWEKDMLLNSDTPAKVADYKSKWDESHKRIDELVKKARETSVNDEERTRLDQLSAQVAQYAIGIDAVHVAIKSGETLSAGAWNAKLAASVKEVIHQTETLAGDLYERGNKRIEGVKPELAATEREVSIMLGSVTAVVLLMAALLAWLISRSVTGPVAEAVRIAEALAKGDLDQKVEVRSKDELGRLMLALQGTVGQLAGIVGRIKESTDMVNTASREIAQGNADLSSRTEEQASALEETSASMQQMTATVSQNAENAKKANELAAQASGVAVKGGDVVRDAVVTMNGITESSKRIADIIGVIDGIAFQTNILALNAAVEAARAGEQGRGFAVVASEVRNLAQRSAAAAKEIKDLITDSVSKVDAGSRQVNDAGRTMEEVVQSVKKVTGLIAEITAASQEQAQGIEQVSETMTQMEKVTQQNAAMVEEASAAAGSLEEQARSLASAVAVFQLETTHAAPAKPAPAKAPTHNVVAMPKRAAQEAAAKPHVPHAQPRAAAPKAAVAAKGKPAHDEGWQEF